MNRYSKSHSRRLNRKRKIAELARNFDYEAFLNETSQNESSTPAIDHSLNRNTGGQDETQNGFEHTAASGDHIPPHNDISQQDDIPNENSSSK